jgi:hypothetical protein
MDKVFQVLLVFLFLLFVISRFIKQQEQVFTPYWQTKPIPVPESFACFQLVADAVTRSLFLLNEMNLWVINLDEVSTPVLKFHGEHFRGLVMVTDKQIGVIYREEGALIQFNPAFELPAENIQVEFHSPDFVLYDPHLFMYLVFPRHLPAVQCIAQESNVLSQTFALPGIAEFAISDLQGSIFVSVPGKNMLVEIDLQSGGMMKRWYVAPGIEPGKMAIDKKIHRLFILCRNNMVVVFDYATGKPVTAIRLSEKSCAVHFDDETNILYLLDVAGTLRIYRQGHGIKYSLLQTVSVSGGPAEMAIDPKTKRIFLSPLNPATGITNRNETLIHVLENQG